MAKTSAVLRSVTGGYMHWCPGCEHAHTIRVGATSGPNWTFDGNVDAPTFGPSIRVFEPARAEHTDPDGKVWPARPEKTICHYFIQGGVINFCGDCEHEFSGRQGVPMPSVDRDDYGWNDD